MYVNETLCSDEQDVANMIDVLVRNNFAYAVDGLMVYFWS